MAGDGRRGSVLVAGSANIDFVVRVPHIPAPGETVLGGDLSVVPGGKGANQAIAAARAGGAETRLLAALGDGNFARVLIASLENAGVALHRVASDRPTGAALITVSDEGENAIAVAPGANGSLRPDDLPDLAGVALLLMQLETPLPTVTAFAQKARAASVATVLNAAPAQALPADLLAALDALVVNEEELAAIAPGDTIAARLRSTGVTAAVATLGGRGACALVDGNVLLQPAFAVTPVDTTAAGDTFCGALAGALASGEPWPDALRFAVAAGALATTKPGAQPGIPARAEILALLATGTQGDTAALAAYCGAPA